MPRALPFVCAGAAHWDVIGHAAAALPAGADVPGRVTRRPGGVAQNIARALAALAPTHRRPVSLLAAIGRDPAGAELAASLAAAGIDVAHLHRHDDPTDCYLAIEGPDGALHAAVADCTGLERAGLDLVIPLPDAHLVLDGNLPGGVLAALLRQPGASAALVPASPGKAARLAPRLDALLSARPLALYLNRHEAEALCDRPFADALAAARALLDRGASEVLVTDGPRPAASAGGWGSLALSPPAVAPRTVTGAGDALVAAHLSARADARDPATALGAALDAAARHISREAPR